VGGAVWARAGNKPLSIPQSNVTTKAKCFIKNDIRSVAGVGGHVWATSSVIVGTFDQGLRNKPLAAAHGPPVAAYTYSADNAALPLSSSCSLKALSQPGWRKKMRLTIAVVSLQNSLSI
jgi:hypothetical protein